MTTIDITKSQFLLPLLKNMVSGLTQLSTSDGTLNQKVYELHHFLSDPKQINGEELMAVIKATKDLASSYEIKRSPGSLVSELPSIFYNTTEELEHIIQSKKLSAPLDNKVGQLYSTINQFYRLATDNFFDEIKCPQCNKSIKVNIEQGLEGYEIKLPDLCPHCHFPVSEALYDNIGFGGEF